MSRRNALAQQQRIAQEQVQYAKQCYSWSRSLERNDADTAAVLLLNRRLKELRSLIPAKILLDLGEGKIRLAPDGRDVLVRVIKKEKRGRRIKFEDVEFDNPLAVEFLLRFKLRRKLLSRLARRLNRVAAHMDGNLEVPYQPKYGDLRLHCDKESVATFFQLRQQKDMMMLDMMAKRESDDLERLTQKDQVTEKEDVNREEPTIASEPEEPAVAPEPPTADDVASKDEPKDSGEHQGVESNDKDVHMKSEDSTEPPPEEESGQAPLNPSKSMENVSSSVPETNASADANEQVSSESLEKEEQQQQLEVPLDPKELLREFKDAYEKTIAPNGDVKFTILDASPATPDYVGAGIGATSRSMSDKEKEAEYQRWQTNMLARIPEQPTYADLGLEYRVFNLEKRRAEAEQEVPPEESEEDTEETNKKEETKVQDDAMDIDAEATDDEDAGVVSKETDEEADDKTDGKEMNVTEQNTKEEKGEEENEDAKKGDKDEQEAKNVVTRPISLAAVPSFYDQDLRRIKNIHADLIKSSVEDHARTKLENSIKEYNIGCRELLQRRHVVQNQILEITREVRSHEHHYAGDYHMRFAVEKNRWNVRRSQFEQRKLDALLPSRRRHMIQGTQRTQSYRLIPDRTGVADKIGECLGDVIDAVDGIANGMLRNDRFNEPFRPPPPPPTFDQSRLQRLKSIEEEKRTDMKTLTHRLQQTEEARKKAWRKVMKTKAEFEIPHQHVGNDGRISNVHLTMNNYASYHAPLLQHANALRLPADHEMQRSAAQVASYTPVNTSRAPSQSIYAKYAPARIRERTAADGSIAPASKPKQNKEGLYLRPAGRTRKGMLWDAVEGIWRPDPKAS